MSKPLSNRLDKLEADALSSAPSSRNLHFFINGINPDGTLSRVLETIIEKGVVIASMQAVTKEQPCHATK